MAVHHPLDTFATSLGTSLGVEALCENADLIERFREPPQAAAVGEHSQCLLDDLLWTLANACPSSRRLSTASGGAKPLFDHLRFFHRSCVAQLF